MRVMGLVTLAPKNWFWRAFQSQPTGDPSKGNLVGGFQSKSFSVQTQYEKQT